MHREQQKCNLRQPAPVAETDPRRPDYSVFTANLHAAKLKLFVHMIGTALADACRFGRRGNAGSSKSPE